MSQINNVFLIDDDQVFNLINARTMEKISFTENVKTFDNAYSALLELRQLSRTKSEAFPDMIFLDLNMPAMNGWEFLDEYEKFSDTSGNKCKIVILTSSIDQNDIRQSKNYKTVKDFISKPLTLKNLESLTADSHY